MPRTTKHKPRVVDVVPADPALDPLVARIEALAVDLAATGCRAVSWLSNRSPDPFDIRWTAPAESAHQSMRRMAAPARLRGDAEALVHALTGADDPAGSPWSVSRLSLRFFDAQPSALNLAFDRFHVGGHFAGAVRLAVAATALARRAVGGADPAECAEHRVDASFPWGGTPITVRARDGAAAVAFAEAYLMLRAGAAPTIVGVRLAAPIESAAA